MALHLNSSLCTGKCAAGVVKDTNTVPIQEFIPLCRPIQEFPKNQLLHFSDFAKLPNMIRPAIVFETTLSPDLGYTQLSQMQTRR